MATSDPGPGVLGTRLATLMELLDGGIGQVYAEIGLPGLRARFAPVLLVVADDGPCSIRAVATAIDVTHSAASQTVAAMARAGLVEAIPGRDARTRMVTLTDEGRRVLPALRAEVAATTTATRELETELSMPLHVLVDEALAALARRPMRDRIIAADPGLLGVRGGAAGAGGRRAGGPPHPPRRR
ncbi:MULTISPECIES: MarR family winged helix-turn-helix transcriptional regulator [unclassified Micromonospora]|uniref:MarR family winged helix-turn-helix transcriptional regulator n=1 Tax=unclassified Micromonospora TaxID=2617518 RepID=UPI001590E1E3|nr:MarR family transcriptional regulator [Verrucosispora sp. NA02020]QKW14069.1 winged helix DNA-binding protein [Verrucosispora sp. NA02020]